jgi:hypothetical protein
MEKLFVLVKGALRQARRRGRLSWPGRGCCEGMKMGETMGWALALMGCKIQREWGSEDGL